MYYFYVKNMTYSIYKRMRPVVFYDQYISILLFKHDYK